MSKQSHHHHCAYTFLQVIILHLLLVTGQQFYPENVLNIISANNLAQANPLANKLDPSAYNKPIYIDTTSSVCPIIYYPPMIQKFRVAKNCSNLNLASNWTSILTPNDNFFITELLLANNKFQYQLPYQVINNYDSLMSLDLNRCDLLEMNLTGNSFTRFPTFRNNCMYQLEVLRLDRNILLTSLNYSFPYYRMPNLRYLDLSYCSISFINTPSNVTILENFPRLEYLNLIGNRLREIYENPFFRLYHLLYLNFELNQIQCTRPNLWLKKFLQSRKLYTIELATNLRLNQSFSPTCLGCVTNQTFFILNLTDNAFCTDIYLNTSIKDRKNIIVDSGRSVDLDCQLYSIPASDLWWTYNDRVLSKTVSRNSPYEFIENFSNEPYLLNKTSILRIKNFRDDVSGVYSCNAWYLDIPNLDKNSIKSIKFGVTLNDVYIRPPGLSPGEIAAIVIGALLGFLLLCLLCCLCAFCCCYKRGLFCCFKSNDKSSTTSITDLYVVKGKDFEENSSGFNEINKTKPNYVINTISKSSSYLNEANCDYNIYKPGQVECSSSSWHITHSPVLTTKKVIIEDRLCPINNNETYVYNVKESIKTSCAEECQNTDMCLSDNYEIRRINHQSPASLSQAHHHHHHHHQPPPPQQHHNTCSEFETRHYVSSPTHHRSHHHHNRPQDRDKLVNDKTFYKQVIITDEGNTYNIMSPASRKQYVSSSPGGEGPHRVITTTNACFKYDSDV